MIIIISSGGGNYLKVHMWSVVQSSCDIASKWIITFAKDC